MFADIVDQCLNSNNASISQILTSLQNLRGKSRAPYIVPKLEASDITDMTFLIKGGEGMVSIQNEGGEVGCKIFFNGLEREQLRTGKFGGNHVVVKQYYNKGTLVEDSFWGEMQAIQACPKRYS